MTQDYSHIFRAKRRLITSIRRRTRPLLMDTSYGKQYLFPKPVKLVNMLQAWNEEDTTNDFLLKGYNEDGVIICGSYPNYVDRWDVINFERIPVEDLVRLDGLAMRRINKGWDKPFKLPKIIPLAPIDPEAHISGDSIHIHEDGGFQQSYVIGMLKLCGYFWFARGRQAVPAARQTVSTLAAGHRHRCAGALPLVRWRRTGALLDGL